MSETQPALTIKEEKNDKKFQSTQSNNQKGSNQQQNQNQVNKDQDGNQVWVSSQKRPPFYGNIALRMLQKHETVELHGLGNAIAAAVEVSQYLIPTGRAVLEKITTSTIPTSASRKPEVVIILHRTAKALENLDDADERDDEDQD